MVSAYENFVRLCVNSGKTPSKVALEIGISKSIVSRWKSGGGITDTTAAKIANYFNIPVKQLISPGDTTKPLNELIDAAQKKEPAPKTGDRLSMYDIQVLKWFHSLPEEKRRAILSLGDAPEALRADRSHE